MEPGLHLSNNPVAIASLPGVEASFVGEIDLVGSLASP